MLKNNLIFLPTRQSSRLTGSKFVRLELKQVFFRLTRLYCSPAQNKLLVNIH